MSSQADNVASALSQGETMAYHQGVIDGYHDFAIHVTLPMGVASREELEAMRLGLMRLKQPPPAMNLTQKSDWVRGYIDGYNIHRGR